ncbi:MAG: flagellar hook protein FlgE [Archangium sp.]|nr:flagellar hook protein FlgE [Archangium sp.]
MSLLSALTTGTAGLQANSTELSVIGDNIANANTIGFKAGRAAFQDQLLQEIIGSPGGGQMGLGSRLQAIQRLVTQGSIMETGLATDLALDGSGYFVVRGAQAGVQGQFYTRAGQFRVDESDYLSTLDGLRVQGYPNTGTGQARGNIGDLKVGSATAVAVPTGNITIRANLDSNAPIPTAAFDPLDPSATASFATTTTIYDTLGNAHTVDVYWQHTAPGTWEFHAVTDGANVTGGTAGQGSEIATGTLDFDTAGALVSSTQSSNFLPTGATQPQALTFNLGTPIPTGTGLDGVTQFAGAGTTTFVSQDGSSYGELASIQINTRGEVIGAFTNGATRILGQVAVADFEAPDRLQRMGGNMLQETVDSGQPTIGDPGAGGRGVIKSGALEQSNVDLANEFVRMIAAQRGFQANSKTITTADQLLQELMQIKR